MIKINRVTRQVASMACKWTLKTVPKVSRMLPAVGGTLEEGFDCGRKEDVMVQGLQMR